MQHKHRILLWVCAVALAVVAVGAAVYANWIGGRFLPQWVEWNNVELATDLNNDGRFEAVSLENRQLSIYEDGQLRCTTPEGWFVSDVFVGDLESDGTQEIVCLTWKRGSYGQSRPFWVTHDTEDFTQHVFIFRYVDGNLEHRWLSSDIGMEVERASLDAHMRLHLQTHDGPSYLCEWQTWGLSYVDEDNPSMREADYRSVSVLAVGDAIAHTGMLQEAEDPATGTYDFSPLFANVMDFVSAHDVAAVNQETPLVDDPTRYSGKFPLFGTPTAFGDALAGAGFNVITAATNHAGDQGVQGIDNTLSFWRTSHPDATLLGLNSTPANADAITYRDVDGVRIALFDYTFGLNSAIPLDAEDAWRVDTLADVGRLKTQLATARGEADANICFLHDGEEYASGPSPEEEVLVEQLIDAGADVVVCTHPHVVQRSQTVTTAQGNTDVVCYSLGNFVANQPNPATVLGAGVSLVLEKPTPGEGVPENTRARVASCQIVPTVSHFADGRTEVYLLQDYSAKMAGEHYLNSIDAGSVTRDGLQAQWVALTQSD